jgi:thioredoxin 1
MKFICIDMQPFVHSQILNIMQVIGDASPDASKLMKREGVRSVPSFHYFKNGEKVDVVNGANAEAIEAAITKNL